MKWLPPQLMLMQLNPDWLTLTDQGQWLDFAQTDYFP